MVIAFRSGANDTEDVNLSGGNIVLGAPSGIQSGDLRIHWTVQEGGTGSPSLPTGMTSILAGNSGGVYWRAARRTAGASEGSYTHTTPGTESLSLGRTLVVTGHDPTNPINASAAGYTGATSSPVTLPTVTTTVDGCRIVYIVSILDFQVPSMSQTQHDTGWFAVSSDTMAIYYEDQATAGTTTARNVSFNFAPQAITYLILAIAPAVDAEPEEHSVAGTVTLALSATATAAKTAGAAGALALSLTASDDAAKTAAATGSATLGLDLAAEAVKLADTIGAAGITLTADGTAAKVATAAGEVTVTLDLTGAGEKVATAAGEVTVTLTATGAVGTEDIRSVTGAVGLALSATSTAAKTADVAGAVALALDLAADPAKVAAAAGQIGIDLTATALAQGIAGGSTVGELALVLAVTATAAKSASVTGSVPLDLAATGTAAKVATAAGPAAVSVDLAGRAAKVATATGSVTLSIIAVGTALRVSAIAYLASVLRVARPIAVVDVDHAYEVTAVRRRFEILDARRGP